MANVYVHMNAPQTIMHRLRQPHPGGMRWDWQHCEHLLNLMGRRWVEVPVARARALSEAIDGKFQYLDEADGAGLERQARQLWALGALVGLIDGEIAGLRTLREGLDVDGIELSRAEAPARAIFDASPEAVLARKYEAATERGLYRALREFREVQGIAPQVEAIQSVASDPAEELGSSFPDPPAIEDESPDVDLIPDEVAIPAVEAVSAVVKPRPDLRRVRRKKR